MQIVGELMTREVITVKETQNLSRADELLRLYRIRHLPVVRHGKLVGLLTHRDLLKAAAMHATDPAAQPLWAADVMTRDVRAVRPDTPLKEAVALMLQNKYGCLPVVDAEGMLLGILTESDLLRYARYLIDERDRRELSAEFGA